MQDLRKLLLLLSPRAASKRTIWTCLDQPKACYFVSEAQKLVRRSLENPRQKPSEDISNRERGLTTVSHENDRSGLCKWLVMYW